MKILDLRVHGVYYDLIKAKKKKREYRKLDDYYVGRLIGGLNGQDMDEVIKNLRDPSARDEYMKKNELYYRCGSNPNAYTHVRFRRGANTLFLTVPMKDLFVEAGQFVIVLDDEAEYQESGK